jgi:bilin biosynthesis PecF protein
MPIRLVTPEDWGLRYAATVSLQEIGTPEACAFLQVAQNQESDKVVLSRITVALEGDPNKKIPNLQ